MIKQFPMLSNVFQYRLNRILSYYFLDFSLTERVKLWQNLVLNEVLKLKRRRDVPLKDIKIGNMFVISLKHRSDRRRHMKALTRSHKIDFKFFDAVSPSGISEFKSFFTNLSFRSLTSGSKACAASHILLWKQISEQRNNSLYIICEDDVIFDKQFDVSTIGKELPDDTDIIYFGSQNNRGRDIAYSVSEKIVRSYNPRRGLYGYAVTPMGAHKLIEHCIPVNTLYGGLDTKVGKVVRQNLAKAYQIIPNLISIEPTFPSDIFNPSFIQKKLYTDTLK